MSVIKKMKWFEGCCFMIAMLISTISLVLDLPFFSMAGVATALFAGLGLGSFIPRLFWLDSGKQIGDSK